MLTYLHITMRRLLKMQLIVSKKQSYRIEDIFIIDDGSSDQTAHIAQNCGVKVFFNQKNMGRGFTRAKAYAISKT